MSGDVIDLLKPVKRMTPKRKADIINAVRDGSLDESAVIQALDLSAEEWASWRRRYDLGGRRRLSIVRHAR